MIACVCFDFICMLRAVNKLGVWGLFTRGLPLRVVMIGTLTGAQWGLYDAFKVACFWTVSLAA